MNTLKLSELIGKEILELRFHYVPENEYGLQSFHSYIKLDNNTIIDIPKSDDNEYPQLTQQNLDYCQREFDTGKFFNDKIKAYFLQQKIIDFYFSYQNNEVDFDYSAFIKLSNGYYLSENNFGQVGLTNIDLVILDEEHFVQETKRLNNIGIDVRSFVKAKNAC